VAFGLRHLPRAERAARVDEVLHLVRLAHTARRYPHELSGGEQQRIALARALAPRPVVVLLDEPFASLDEQLRDEVRVEVAEVLAQQGTAAVLVTHDRAEALTLGHRVAVMNSGRVVQIGPPDEVYEHPADAFVEGFLATTRWRA
jgi:ABC-type sulfate/molybdate transport systems ATPase subunit